MMNVNYVETVGNVTSFCGMYALCGSLFTHALPLSLSQRFSFKISNDDNAFDLSSCINLGGSITAHAHLSMACSCVSSMIAAFAALSLIFLSHALRLYCSIKYPQTAILSVFVAMRAAFTMCSVSSMSRVEVVAACICLLLLFCATTFVVFVASIALLCACTSPSCKNIHSEYLSYG
jgi:hypothetical protein